MKRQKPIPLGGVVTETPLAGSKTDTLVGSLYIGSIIQVVRCFCQVLFVRFCLSGFEGRGTLGTRLFFQLLR